MLLSDTMSSRRKSPQINIVLSPQLLARTKELAQQADKTLAEWVRDALREKAAREEGEQVKPDQSHPLYTKFTKAKELPAGRSNVSPGEGEPGRRG
jgi:hypothetical protein